VTPAQCAGNILRVVRRDVHEAFFVETETMSKKFMSVTEALAIPAETKAFRVRDEPEALWHSA